MSQRSPDSEETESLYNKLFDEAEHSGYHLNPNKEFTLDLVKGLLTNEERYGYWACPCRLADGVKELDLDIICPCDYRDADLNEFDACFCKLYVSKAALEGKKKIGSIPERRPLPENRNKSSETDLPVWRCRVCGYLCARDEAPEVCPICKAKKEMFEKFEKL